MAYPTLVLFANLIMSKFVIEGVGSGFFAMLSYLIVAVFLCGLITCETANFFGKDITINEINYVIIVFLVMPGEVGRICKFLLKLHAKYRILPNNKYQYVKRLFKADLTKINQRKSLTN